jgi:hypothetical protein
VKQRAKIDVQEERKQICDSGQTVCLNRIPRVKEAVQTRVQTKV